MGTTVRIGAAMVSISRNGIAILIQIKRSLVNAFFKRFQMNAKSFDLDMYCCNYSTAARAVTYTALRNYSIIPVKSPCIPYMKVL